MKHATALIIAIAGALLVRFTGRWIMAGTATVAAAACLAMAGSLRATRYVMDRAAARYSPLQLTAQGLGGFPNRRRPRVLWVGIRGETQQLECLQQDIDSGLAALGWPGEKRPFKGHLTLARARGRRSFERNIEPIIAQCAPREPFAFVADKLTLYRSRLRPEGAVYDICSQRVLNRLAEE